MSTPSEREHTMTHRTPTAFPAGCPRMLRRLASLIAVVLLALPAAAQSTIRVEAGFTQQAVYLGDQAVFTVIVENADSVDPPDLSGIPGADFN